MEYLAPNSGLINSRDSLLAEGFDYALVDRSACGDVINRLESPPTLEILQPAGNEFYTAREISAPGNTFDYRRQGNLDTITCYKCLPIKPYQKTTI